MKKGCREGHPFFVDNNLKVVVVGLFLHTDFCLSRLKAGGRVQRKR
jgi:hypothetical protein